MSGSADIPGADGRDRAGSRDFSWLVLRSQAGDRRALEDLLREAQEILRPYVVSMMGEPFSGSDVLQDVLLIIYRKLGNLREPRAFAGWARRIASREVYRALRASRDAGHSLEELSDSIADAHSTIETDHLRDELPPLLDKLSPSSREVIFLHYLEDLTIEEVAATLDIAPGTVKSRLAYGLRTLRRFTAGSSQRA